MDRYTVMLVPAGAGAVRRFEIGRIWLRRLALTGLVLAAAVAAIAMDWAHLRREAAELARLRAEAAAQREQLQGYDEQIRGYADKVRDVEAQLGSLREFERKVRIIANLPAASNAASVEAAPSGLGVGGGADDPALATPPIGAPTGANLRRSPPPAPAGEARPRDAAADGNPHSWSRDFTVLDHAACDGVDGLVSIVGGKLTSFRLMAEKTSDVVCEKLGISAACRTAEVGIR